MTCFGAVTIQVKVAVPKAPLESVAVTVTVDEPTVVGEPEIKPVDEIDNPAGKLTARYVKVEATVSVARACTLTAVPVTVDCAPGLVTVTTCAVGDVIDHVNVAVPKAPVESVAVTVTEYDPASVGEPEITPVVDTMPNPAGNPDALYVNVDATESVALIAKFTDEPSTVDCAPGFVTVTTCGGSEVIVQANVALAKAPVASVAVAVTATAPATVGVPEINPVEALIDKPAGKPVAE